MKNSRQYRDLIVNKSYLILVVWMAESQYINNICVAFVALCHYKFTIICTTDHDANSTGLGLERKIS